jgi:hypothetical protein
MSEISDRFYAYKAASDGKQVDPPKADIAKAYEAYKANVAKPPTPAPAQSFGETFSQVYGGSSEQQFGPEASKETVKALPSLLPVAGMMAGSALGPPGILAGAAYAGGGAMAGKAAENIIRGEGVSKGTIWEGAKGAALEGFFRGAGVAAEAAIKYVANSPRILNALANIASGLTKGEYTPFSIKSALERAGVPGAMKAIEEETEATKFAPRGKGNLAVENVNIATKKGSEKMAEVQNNLKAMRDAAGKEVGRVDDLLAKTATQKGETIATTEITNAIKQDIKDIKDNPLLAPIINTKKMEALVKSLEKTPTMTVEQAIKARRLIKKEFEDFSNKGAMAVKDYDLVSQTMSKSRVKLKELIQLKAKQLGITEFDDVYKSFGKFADDFDDNLAPLFGSKEGAKFLEDRFISLSNEIVRRGNVLENIQNTKSLLLDDRTGAVAKSIDDLTDMLIIRSLYQNTGTSPSSPTAGVFRKMVVEPLVQSFVKAGNIAEAAKPLAPATPTLVAPAISLADIESGGPIANFAAYIARKLTPEQIKDMYKEKVLDKPAAAKLIKQAAPERFK